MLRSLHLDPEDMVRSWHGDEANLPYDPNLIFRGHDVVVKEACNKDDFNALRRKWAAQGIPTRTHKMFHGTHGRYISKILAEGLKAGDMSCAFGSGIYMGQWGKAVCFAGATRIGSENDFLGGWRWVSGHYVHYVLEIEVLLGNIWHKPPSPEHFKNKRAYPGVMRKLGCQSLTYTNFKQQEWVVYNPAQVLVKRIILVQEAQNV